MDIIIVSEENDFGSVDQGGLRSSNEQYCCYTLLNMQAAIKITLACTASLEIRQVREDCSGRVGLRGRAKKTHEGRASQGGGRTIGTEIDQQQRTAWRGDTYYICIQCKRADQQATYMFCFLHFNYSQSQLTLSFFHTSHS